MEERKDNSVGQIILIRFREHGQWQARHLDTGQCHQPWNYEITGSFVFDADTGAYTDIGDNHQRRQV